MDFLEPNKKRNRAIRLMIGYVLVVIAIFLGTLLLTFIALGYGFSRSTGSVTQNGLLFVDAHPQQANITINGQDRGRTEGRFVLESGNYSVGLKREGYQDWQKTAEVGPGGIVRLVYPFLFPSKLETKLINKIESPPDIVSASPDRRWIISHKPSRPSSFYLTDTSTKENLTTEFNVPSDVFGAQATNQKLEVIEWSADTKGILVRYASDSGFGFAIINRDKPSESINITKIIGAGSDRVRLFDKKSDQVVVVSSEAGLLNKVSIKDGKTETVARGVIDYWPYKDNLFMYVTKDKSSNGKVSVMLLDDKKEYKLRSLSEGKQYFLNIAEFQHDMYVAVGSATDGKVYVHKNPLSVLRDGSNKQSQYTLLKLDNPTSLLFSANARFVALQAGSKFAVYDFEVMKQHKFDTKLDVPSAQKFGWMDGHRLVLVSGGKTNVFEFDGQNTRALADSDPAFMPMFDRDYTALFTYRSSNNTNESGIFRTELIVKK